MRFLVMLYGMVLRYWPMKLLAFLLAVVLWVYVQSLEISNMTVSVPVDYLNLPRHLVFKQDPPRFISIKLKGTQEVLQFNSRRLTASVDLTSAIRGKSKYNIDFDQEQLPSGIEVTYVPKNVELHLSQLIELWVKVEPNFSGKLPSGFEMGQISVNPTKIKILTSEELASEIDKISTQPIELEDRKGSFSTVATLKVQSNKIYRYEPTTVNIDVIVFENNKEDKKMIRLPIRIKNLDDNLEVILSQTAIHILVQGDPQKMENLNARDFEATIDLEKTFYNKKTKKIDPDFIDAAVPVNVKISKFYASKLSIVDISPMTIEVKYFIKEQF